MAISPSGFGKDSAKHMIINSGVIYKNVKFDKSKPEDGFTEATLLGASQGGVEVNIQNSIRKIEVDGTYFTDVKGTNVYESGKAEFTATIVEMSPEMIAMAGHAKVTKSAMTGYDRIDGKYTVTDEDYIENIVIVGQLNGSEKYVIFVFENVLITSDLKIKMEDKSEGSVEMTGQSNATYEQLQGKKSSWHIFYPQGMTGV